MNKKARNFYLIVAGVVLMIGYSYFKENKNRNNVKADFKPSYKESKSQDEFTEHFDSTTKIYSNYKYGFSMDFPDNWSTDMGVSEHTIIRAGVKDSVISFAINVIEIDDASSTKYSIWDMWDNKSMGLEKSYFDMLSSSVKSDIYNFTPRKVYVNNNEAIEIKFNYLVKEVDLEYEMQSIIYSVFISPYTYTISQHIPKIFYDINTQRYNYLINNFVFMKPTK